MLYVIKVITYNDCVINIITQCVIYVWMWNSDRNYTGGAILIDVFFAELRFYFFKISCYKFFITL